MHRLIGTISVVALLLTLGSSAANAYDSPQKYGIEFRGAYNQYDMGDVDQGAKFIQGNNPNRSLTSQDKGPSGGFSILYRSSKHAQWEVGYNALMDVDNKIAGQGDSSGQILMHANEFFAKGSIIATLSKKLDLDFGAGISYYNTELQIQDDFDSKYIYDAVGRAFGLIGAVGLEYDVTQRFGIHLGGGFRYANTTWFSYEPSGGTRTGLNVLGGSRPFEVNMTGGYGVLGLRFYFDPTTKPVDFAR